MHQYESKWSQWCFYHHKSIISFTLTSGALDICLFKPNAHFSLACDHHPSVSWFILAEFTNHHSSTIFIPTVTCTGTGRTCSIHFFCLIFSDVSFPLISFFMSYFQDVSWIDVKSMQCHRGLPNLADHSCSPRYSHCMYVVHTHTRTQKHTFICSLAAYLWSGRPQRVSLLAMWYAVLLQTRLFV